MPYPLVGRCADCEHLDVNCEFSQRMPSLKRRRTSRRIASRLTAAASAPATASSRQRWPQRGSVVAAVKDGDSQLVPVGGTGHSGGKMILRDDAVDLPESTVEKYWRYVHPLTPFLPLEMIIEGKGDGDPILQHCIELAASLWLHHKQTGHSQHTTAQLLAVVSQGEMSLPVIAGLLLVVLRVPLPDTLVQLASTRSVLFSYYSVSGLI
jgi:hypothetical protein